MQKRKPAIPEPVLAVLEDCFRSGWLYCKLESLNSMRSAWEQYLRVEGPALATTLDNALSALHLESAIGTQGHSDANHS